VTTPAASIWRQSAEWSWRGRRSAGSGGLPGQGLAILGVEVPLPALGVADGVEQHAVASPQRAVEMLEQPLLAAGEDLGRLAARGVEVAAGNAAAGNGLALGPVIQLGVEPPLIGLLPFEGAGAVVGDQGVEVGRQALAVAGIVDRDMAHAVAGSLELAREVAHRREDRDHLLRVVHDVVGLLAHFQQEVDDVGPGLAVPVVLRVELVAQDEAQGRAVWLGGRCQRGCRIVHGRLQSWR